MGQDIESLQSIMSRMSARLDDILPDGLQDVPGDSDWPLIHIYLKVDPLLAQLYKQYCDARAKLDQLVRERGANDPMTEVASDMKDSARTSVETRLIELKEDSAAQGEIARRRAIGARQTAADPLAALDQIMTFMLCARLALKNMPSHQRAGARFRRQFRLAA